jgi:Zn-dependent peptidase ImmA (M78 family)
MEEYLARLQKLLRLENWDITYQEVPTFEQSARTKMIYNDYRAVVQIKVENKIQEKKFSLIHELIHLVFRDAVDEAYSGMKGYAHDNFEKFNERGTEQMAKVVYFLLEGVPYDPMKTE